MSITPYATKDRVEALVGDIVSNRVFTASTIPTDAQVNAFLVTTASEINAALAFAGYTVPVDEAADPATHEWITQLNAIGAAAFALSTLPTQAWVEPGEESPSNSRRQFLEKRYNAGLKRIEEQKLAAGGLTLRRNTVRSGAAQDENSRTKKPIFTRGLMDFPGSRSLTES